MLVAPKGGGTYSLDLTGKSIEAGKVLTATLDNIDWEETTKTIYSKTESDVLRALGKEHCDVDDFMALISPEGDVYKRQPSKVKYPFSITKEAPITATFSPTKQKCYPCPIRPKEY